MLRLFGIPESEIAETLRVASDGIDLSPLEITTCLRRGELEVVIRSEPSADGQSQSLIDLIADRHSNTLFSTDGSTIDDQVAELLRGRRIAVGESCTGGLLAARLTERPGASEYFAGGVVAYSDEAKIELLGVPAELIEHHGAVSEEVATALADGALERFGANVAIGLTGIAGPGGGSEEKPVGRVCFCLKTIGSASGGGDGASGGDSIVRALDLPGARSEVRDRSTTVAFHLLRRLLRGEGVPDWGTRARS
jgi:nicotinamide-nucleotide amidase